MIQKVITEEGFFRLYKGFWAAALGSVVYRGSAFALYDTLCAEWKGSELMESEIPFTFGLQPKILLAGLASGCTRACLECPFEYVKVKL